MLDRSEIYFNNNAAQNGSALYLNELATLMLDRHISLKTFGNQASDYGGVLYHEDNTTPLQCHFENMHETSELSTLPYCFLRFEFEFTKMVVTSLNDSAGIDGNYMYGGLLDRCQMPRKMRFLYSSQSIVPFEVFIKC